jgi:hypothetical protein
MWHRNASQKQPNKDAGKCKLLTLGRSPAHNMHLQQAGIWRLEQGLPQPPQAKEVRLRGQALFLFSVLGGY